MKVPALAISLAVFGLSLTGTGCSVVRINGSYPTADDELCLVRPNPFNDEINRILEWQLERKDFHVRSYPHGTAPGVCRQTLVYTWAKEQYYLPAYVKQYAINLDLYIEGRKFANASFDPTRNLISPQVKYIPFSRYLARTLDRLFPGRNPIGR